MKNKTISIYIFFLMITISVYSQEDYKPCVRLENEISEAIILEYVKNFYAYEQDSNNWYKFYELIHPLLLEQDSLKAYKNQIESMRKKGTLNKTQVSSLDIVGQIYKRENKDYFRVTFKRGYYFDRNKLLFVRKTGDTKWRILPYQTPLNNNLFNYESADVFLDIEEVSGYYCDTNSIELEQIGEYVFNAIKNNNFDDAYCRIGVTHRVTKVVFNKSMDKDKVEYINNLIEKRKGINSCISSIFDDNRIEKINYIKSYNLVEKQDNDDICGVLVEYLVKEKKKPWKMEFIEIECMKTSIGWVMIDDINEYSFRDVNEEIVRKRRNEIEKDN